MCESKLLIDTDCMNACVYVCACICPDLAQQVAETHHFFLQVFGQDDDLAAGGLSLLPGVQREHQLHGGAEWSWSDH